MEDSRGLTVLPRNRDFCHLLITFAASLDPDQAQEKFGTDLDLNCLII